MTASIEIGRKHQEELARLPAAIEPEVPPLPDYLVDVYTWAYVARPNVEFLDREPVVSMILWGQQNRLMRSARAEIEPGSRVLQPAAVYGRLCTQLAEHIGPEGEYHVTDIQPIQIEHVGRKTRGMRQVRIGLSDARTTGDGLYDTVCCYFLMHEVPEDYKRAIANNLAARVKPGGKLMFVDYHQPALLHPMRPVIWLVFKWLEPFAKALWTTELKDYVDDREAFSWRKETIFGGLYQKVVGVKR